MVYASVLTPINGIRMITFATLNALAMSPSADFCASKTVSNLTESSATLRVTRRGVSAAESLRDGYVQAISLRPAAQSAGTELWSPFTRSATLGTRAARTAKSPVGMSAYSTDAANSLCAETALWTKEKSAITGTAKGVLRAA